MIQAIDLRKEYQSEAGPVIAVDGLTFTASAAEFVAIMGPSGCGKSTFLNLLGGLDRPTSGYLHVDGVDLAALSEARLTRYRRSQVGIIFQFYNLLSTLSVHENIVLPALLAGMGEKNAALKAGALARRVGLSQRLTSRPHQLSGGEMQRAAIARALINDPAIVLADEPTGNLDSHSADEVLRLLRELADERSATVVMVTHSTEAAAVADRVVRMVDGRIPEQTDAPTAAR